MGLYLHRISVRLQQGVGWLGARNRSRLRLVIDIRCIGCTKYAAALVAHYADVSFFSEHDRYSKQACQGHTIESAFLLLVALSARSFAFHTQSLGSAMQQASSARARQESPPFRWRLLLADAAREDDPGAIPGRRNEVGWQVYLREWDCFISYSASQTRAIEVAWQQEKSQVTIGGDHETSHTWVICFNSMTQTNAETGTRRPLQRILITHK